MNKCLFTLDRELKTDQLGEPMSIFVFWGEWGWGITWRNMGEVLPIGAEMTQRYLHHQRPIQAYVKAHKSWKPGARCTTRRQFNRLKSVFMGTWLVSASSIQLSLSESSLKLGWYLLLSLLHSWAVGRIFLAVFTVYVFLGK